MKALDVIRRILFLVFAISVVVVLVASSWTGMANTPTQDRQIDFIPCSDGSGNYLGIGFVCEWSANDCYYMPPCCPPEWDCGSPLR